MQMLPDNDNDNGNDTDNDTGSVSGNGTENGNGTANGSVSVNGPVRKHKESEPKEEGLTVTQRDDTHTPKGSRPKSSFFIDPSNGNFAQTDSTKGVLRPKSEKVQYEDHVTLTPTEHARLVKEFGKEQVERMIRIVSDHKGISPGKYGADYNDYYAIRSWGVERYERELQNKPRKPTETLRPSYDRDDLEAYWNSR